MALYSVNALTTGVTTGTAAAEIRTGSTRGVRVTKIAFTLTGVTQSQFGIGRPAAIGITPSTQVLFQADDPTDPASGTNLATAWATGPTVPTNFFRRIDLINQAGMGTILTFEGGLWIPISSGLVLWNLSTGIAVNVEVDLDE